MSLFHRINLIKTPETVPQQTLHKNISLVLLIVFFLSSYNIALENFFKLCDASVSQKCNAKIDLTLKVLQAISSFPNSVRVSHPHLFNHMPFLQNFQRHEQETDKMYRFAYLLLLIYSLLYFWLGCQGDTLIPQVTKLCGTWKEVGAFYVWHSEKVTYSTNKCTYNSLKRKKWLLAIS